MGKGHAVELRERAVAAYRAHRGTLEAIAELFGVHRRTLMRWLRLEEATGSLQPRPHGGGAHRKLTDPAVALVRALVLKRRGIYLYELQTALQTQLGIPISTAALCRLIQRERLRRKRRRSTPASGTPRRSTRSAGATGRRSSPPSRPRRSSSSTRPG
jgi:transposase